MSGGGSGGGFGNTDAAAIGRRLMSGMSATEAVAAETSVDQDPADAASRWVAESLLPMFVAFVQGPDRLKQLERERSQASDIVKRGLAAEQLLADLEARNNQLSQALEAERAESAVMAGDRAMGGKRLLELVFLN